MVDDVRRPVGVVTRLDREVERSAVKPAATVLGGGNPDVAAVNPALALDQEGRPPLCVEYLPLFVLGVPHD